MPIYECSEHQFVENLRKIIDTNFKVIVKKSCRIYDDSKHNISRLPDYEFEKYSTILTRKTPRSNVYSVKPFYDEFHSQFYDEDEKVHSSRYSRMITLSIPYYKVEYSFDIWGETYYHSFDTLFQPQIKLETKRLRTSSYIQGEKRKSVLMYVLSFLPPHPETFSIELPSSVLIFDISRKIKF